MSESPDLVLRLREKAEMMVYVPFETPLLIEAAEAIETMRRDAATLREALEHIEILTKLRPGQAAKVYRAAHAALVATAASTNAEVAAMRER